MGKKGRIKKNNQEKQAHDQVDHPKISPRDSNGDSVDFISTLNDELIHQILPFLLHKWKHQQQEHDLEIIARNTTNSLDPNDFISRLPNNIIYHIIALLPFEFAVQTTLISTHWRHLWKEALLTLVPAATIEDAMNALSTFLDDFTSLHRPRNNWGFKFMLGHGRVLLATVAPNESLQLDFSAGKQQFPRPFDWCLKLFNYNNWNLKKIKSLYLISVSYASNEAVSSMVSNLPFLESLTIRKCYGLRSLQIKEAKRLKKLVVLDCPHLESLSLEGSILKSFGYRGRLVCFDQFEVNDSVDQFEVTYSADQFQVNHPRTDVLLPVYSFISPYYNYLGKFLLNDAMLDFRQGPPLYKNFNHDGFKSMLKSIKSVESLTLCRWVFEALIYRELPSLSKDSEFRLRWLRELWWIDCSMDKENVNSLLGFLKLCPDLERLYVTIDPKSYNMTSTKKFSYKERVGKLSHLKLVKLEGFANENKEIFFVNKLRPLFRISPLILAKSNGAARLRRMGKFPYKFEQVVTGCDETCPADDDHLHIHMKL